MGYICIYLQNLLFDVCIKKCFIFNSYYFTSMHHTHGQMVGANETSFGGVALGGLHFDRWDTSLPFNDALTLSVLKGWWRHSVPKWTSILRWWSQKDMFEIYTTWDLLLVPITTIMTFRNLLYKKRVKQLVRGLA